VRRREAAASANDQHDQAEAKNQDDERNDVGYPVETFRGGRGQYRGAVFLNERLLDQAVAVSALDRGHEFGAHAVGGRAADVIAFQKNLIAAADAHHLMADFVKAGSGIASADQGEDGGDEKDGVGEFAASGLLAQARTKIPRFARDDRYERGWYERVWLRFRIGVCHRYSLHIEYFASHLILRFTSNTSLHTEYFAAHLSRRCTAALRPADSRGRLSPHFDLSLL
jgi:hypothetical protein